MLVLFSASALALALASPSPSNNLALKPCDLTSNTSSTSKFNVEEEVQSAKKAKLQACPRLILLIPLLLANLVLEIVFALLARLWPWKGNPNAQGVDEATPVPIKKAFVGDLIGFVQYFLGQRIRKDPAFWAQGPNGDSTSRNWITNHGYPCVSLMDAKSVEAIIADIDHKKHKRTLCPVKFTSESFMPNFYRTGERSANFRSLLIDMVPTSENDKQFKVATEAMKTASKRWIEENSAEPGDKDEFLSTCINAFASTLIIGEEIPLALMSQISLFLIPSYPRFFSSYFFTLVPHYWGMLKAREHLHKRVKASPYWSKILSKATKLGLTPSDACDTLIPIVGFNAKGLMLSFNTAIDLLPSMNFGEELVKDSKRLVSFAWETLRFNGPIAMMPARDEPTIIKTSAGATHAVKKGTQLSTFLEMAQMDPLVWPEPHSFKADRFLKTKSTTTKENPLPTIAHAMPIGSLDDDHFYNNSHCCVMARLNNRVIEAFIKMMVDLPRYDLVDIKSVKKIVFRS